MVVNEKKLYQKKGKRSIGCSSPLKVNVKHYLS